MTGKQIFWNKSIETDISEIVQEILHYVDSQRDNGTLNPNYYDSILLFIADVLQFLSLDKATCFAEEPYPYSRPEGLSHFSG